MRAPQPKSRGTIRSMRATQPSTPKSNMSTPGQGGSPMMGGAGTMPRRQRGVGQLNLDTRMYLWILVIIEVALIGGFRKYFRRFHGG